MIDDHFEKMQFMPGSGVIAREISVTESYPLYSDPYRLSVILNNLISNAIKYHDPAKEKSSICITAEIQKDRVFLLFEDNGIGIEERYLSKVFDMFFRATDKNKGAGLGLYIVKEAIDKLKGVIKIDSKVGKGTRFQIELPNYVNASVETASMPVAATVDH
jgi:signal transduction histidine kinase